MNLQVRKLNLIEYLIGIRDEKHFKKIENLINNEKNTSLKSLSEKEIIERTLKSEKNYLEGKFKSQDEIEKESENW